MKTRATAPLVLGVLLACCGPAPETDVGSSTPHADAADRLAHEILILDGHVDLPYRLNHAPDDVSIRTENGHFDYVRAREGSLDAPFMSIYVPSSTQGTDEAKTVADELISIVETLASDHPDKFVVATSADEIEAAFDAGKIALPLGMENGAPILDDLDNLRHFFERGVRYITLCHDKDNQIADSSYADTHSWGGLSPFGVEVVREMNRLGIMVDVSHVSDEAFWDIMEVTEAPVIDSHSGCRHFTPGWERNSSDEMIRRLAENGGVLQINFGSAFINAEVQKRSGKAWEHFGAYREEHDLKWSDEEFRQYRDRYLEENPLGLADIEEVADHIDHVVRLVGIDHVGLGSDFDGVSHLPVGLEDVSGYPNLIRVLLDRGYDAEQIRKIGSGNVLRVMREVERVAREASPAAGP